MSALGNAYAHKADQLALALDGATDDPPEPVRIAIEAAIAALPDPPGAAAAPPCRCDPAPWPYRDPGGWCCARCGRDLLGWSARQEAA